MNSAPQAPLSSVQDPGANVAPPQRVGPSDFPLTPEQITDIQQNKDIAALSYLWLLSIVIQRNRRDSPFVQYHARQGIWLFLLSIPIWLVPGVGQYLSFFTLAGMIIGFINAVQGHYADVPFVGALARGTLTFGDIFSGITRVVRQWWSALRRAVMPRGGQSSPAPRSAVPAASVAAPMARATPPQVKEGPHPSAPTVS